MAKITPTSIIQQIIAAAPVQKHQNTAQANPTTTQFIDTEPKRDKKALLRQLKTSLTNTSNLEKQGLQKVIEEVLAWEFGEEIRGAHHFGTTVARVEHLLAQNPKAREKLGKLITILTKKA